MTETQVTIASNQTNQNQILSSMYTILILKWDNLKRIICTEKQKVMKKSHVSEILIN